MMFSPSYDAVTGKRSLLGPQLLPRRKKTCRKSEIPGNCKVRNTSSVIHVRIMMVKRQRASPRAPRYSISLQSQCCAARMLPSSRFQRDKGKERVGMSVSCETLISVPHRRSHLCCDPHSPDLGTPRTSIHLRGPCHRFFRANSYDRSYERFMSYFNTTVYVGANVQIDSARPVLVRLSVFGVST
jgi:hypothetical protein